MAKKKQWVPLHYPSDCMTLYNGKRLVVEGVKDVRFCSREKVILKAFRDTEIRGRELMLSQLGNGTVEVCGIISEICVEAVP